MNRRIKPSEEWFRQAEYDLETAETMFKSKRYIYTIFICHLSVEKALKGLYAKKLRENPPKVHNLNYLCEKIGIQINEEMREFIDNLNNLSVPTRYPESLEQLLQYYKDKDTLKVLKKTKELLICLKKML